MTDYETKFERTMDALDHAGLDFPRTQLWTRAERLAEAQVHATLAVAAAGWAQAGMFPDVEAKHDVDACTGCEFCTPVVRSERADEVGS